MPCDVCEYMGARGGMHSYDEQCIYFKKRDYQALFNLYEVEYFDAVMMEKWEPDEHAQSCIRRCDMVDMISALTVVNASERRWWGHPARRA